MAKQQEINAFFTELDSICNDIGVYTKESLTPDEIEAFTMRTSALCTAFFDKRREAGVGITTLRSDRTQLRNAARKRYANRSVAYRTPDSGKREAVYSEQARRTILKPLMVHPVVNLIDISWEEKDAYFQNRQQQVIARTGEGTKHATKEVLITSVAGIKTAIRDLLKYPRDNQRKRFYALALAVAGATGRRTFEVYAAAMNLPGHDITGITSRQWGKYAATAAIHYLPRRTLFFAGQLKTGQTKNPVREYPIYNLITNKELLPALDELRKIIKTGDCPPRLKSDFSGMTESEINKAVNSSTAGDLGIAAKKSGFERYLEIDGNPVRSLFEAKWLRNIYGHCLYAELVIAAGKHTDFPDFARPLYGHVGADVTSEYKGFRVKGIGYIF